MNHWTSSLPNTRKYYASRNTDDTNYNTWASPKRDLRVLESCYGPETPSRRDPPRAEQHIPYTRDDPLFVKVTPSYVKTHRAQIQPPRPPSPLPLDVEKLPWSQSPLSYTTERPPRTISSLPPSSENPPRSPSPPQLTGRTASINLPVSTTSTLDHLEHPVHYNTYSLPSRRSPNKKERVPLEVTPDKEHILHVPIPRRLQLTPPSQLTASSTSAHQLAIIDSNQNLTSHVTQDRISLKRKRKPHSIRKKDYHKTGKVRSSFEMLKHKKTKDPSPSSSKNSSAATSTSTSINSSNSSEYSSVFDPPVVQHDLPLEVVVKEKIMPGKDVNNNEAITDYSSSSQSVLPEVEPVYTTHVPLRSDIVERASMRLQQKSSANNDDSTDYPVYAQIHKHRYVQYNHTRRKLSFVNKCSTNGTTTTSEIQPTDDVTGNDEIRSDDDTLAVSLHSGQFNVTNKTGTSLDNSETVYSINDVNVNENLDKRISGQSDDTLCIKDFCSCTKAYVLSSLENIQTHCRHLKYSEKSKRRALDIISYLLFIALLWCLGLSLLGDLVKPGGCIFGLLIMYISTFLLHRLFTMTPVPSYIGTIAIGVLFGNIDAITDAFNLHNAVVIPICLILSSMVLIRCGFWFDIYQVNAVPAWLIIRLACLPSLVEMVVVFFIGLLVWEFNYKWALIHSVIMSSAGVDVIVPCYRYLSGRQIGINEHIPTIIYSSSTLCIVLCVITYSLLKGLFLSNISLIWYVLYCPAAGVGYGVLAGVLLWYIPRNGRKYSVIYRVLLAMLLGAVAICSAQNIDFQGAGTLGACILGMVARYGWRRQGINFKITLTNAIANVGCYVEPMLFGLIGFQLKFSSEFSTILSKTVITLLLTIVLRSLACYVCFIYTRLSVKERVFIILAWFSKTSSHVILASLVLWSTVRSTEIHITNIKSSSEIFSTCIITVFVTTLLGILLLQVSTKQLLSSTLQISGCENLDDSENYGATPYVLPGTSVKVLDTNQHDQRAQIVDIKTNEGDVRTPTTDPATSTQSQYFINIRDSNATPNTDDIQSDPDETFL